MFAQLRWRVTMLCLFLVAAAPAIGSVSKGFCQAVARLLNTSPTDTARGSCSHSRESLFRNRQPRWAIFISRRLYRLPLPDVKKHACYVRLGYILGRRQGYRNSWFHVLHTPVI